MSKLRNLLAALAIVAIAPASWAGTMTFATTDNEVLNYSGGANGTFNVDPTSLTNSMSLSHVGLGSYSVIEQINGGAGVGVTNVTQLVAGVFAEYTLAAFTITYAFATPTYVDNVLVTNLLTVNVAAGSDILLNELSGGLTWSASSSSPGVTFTSDLLKFLGVTAESASFSFGSLASGNPMAYESAFTTTTGTANYQSSPLPEVPEPLSAAILVVGMTAVGVAARRRRVG
jgi:hypothetical protein